MLMMMMVMMMMMMIIIIIIIIITIIIKQPSPKYSGKYRGKTKTGLDKRGNKRSDMVLYTINGNKRIVATVYSVGTLFVSGIYVQIHCIKEIIIIIIIVEVYK
jgi:hypothetical protein